MWLISLNWELKQGNSTEIRPDYDIIVKYHLFIFLNCFKLLAVNCISVPFKHKTKQRLGPSNAAKSFGNDRTNKASELKVEQRIWRRYKQIDKDTGPLRNLVLGLLLDL